MASSSTVSSSKRNPEHSERWQELSAKPGHRLIIDCYFWPHELLQMFDPFTSWFCRCLEFAFPKRRFILFVCLNQWSRNPSNIRRRPTLLPLLSAGATCGNPSFAALKLRTGPEEIWRGQSPRWFPSRVVLGCPQFHLDECHHWTTGATHTVCPQMTGTTCLKIRLRKRKTAIIQNRRRVRLVVSQKKSKAISLPPSSKAGICPK